VEDTRTSPGRARPASRAPTWTATPPEPAVLELAFAGVNAGADLEAQVADPFVERAGECHRVGRDVERRKETIARGVDFTPTEQPQPIAEPGMVRPQQRGPGPVTEFAHPTGRVDNVREQDRREHAAREGLEVLEPPSVPVRMLHLGTALSSIDRGCISTMRAWLVCSDPRVLPTSMWRSSDA